MKLLELLSLEDNKLKLRLMVSGVLSGLGSAALLGLVNTAAQEISDNGLDRVNWILAGSFAGITLVYFFAEVFLLSTIGRQIESGIDRIRQRLFAQIALADFVKLEAIGQERLFKNITQSTRVISQNSHLIGMCFRSVMLLIAVMIYVFWISTLAFFLIIGVIGVGIVIYLRMGKRLGEWFGKLGLVEAEMFKKIADLFRGIKEVRMWSRRSDTLHRSFEDVSAKKAEYGHKAHDLISRQMIMGMSAFYILLAVVVFIVPAYSGNMTTELSKISTAILFMIGPIAVMVQSMSVFAQIEGSATRMLELSTELSGIREDIDEENPKKLPAEFDQITFEATTFTYPNRDPRHGFVLGPIDLAVTSGELLFVTGGNGSGKSTLIKLLTGLYRPEGGKIRIDQIELGVQSITSYRNLIATVFSDFHLFADLHGVDQIDPEEANYWLERFEISHVTAIRDGRFVTTALSSGQRKRLGLITAILEKRPILVLDEWAADQDPTFRKKFYTDILPELKKRGMTVIAVTHDDHYFEMADRRIHLENGKLSEVTLDDPRGRI